MSELSQRQYISMLQRKFFNSSPSSSSTSAAKICLKNPMIPIKSKSSSTQMHRLNLTRFIIQLTSSLLILSSSTSRIVVAASSNLATNEQNQQHNYPNKLFQIWPTSPILATTIPSTTKPLVVIEKEQQQQQQKTNLFNENNYQTNNQIKKVSNFSEQQQQQKKFLSSSSLMKTNNQLANQQQQRDSTLDRETDLSIEETSTIKDLDKLNKLSRQQQQHLQSSSSGDGSNKAAAAKGNGKKLVSRVRQKRSSSFIDEQQSFIAGGGDDGGSGRFWHSYGGLEKQMQTTIQAASRSQPRVNHHQQLEPARTTRRQKYADIIANLVSPKHRRANVRSADNQQLQLDCKSLLILWTFLRGSYPSLAAHLFSLSIEQQQGGGGGPSTPLASSSQVAPIKSHNSKTITRLLEKADSLLRNPAAGGNLEQQQQQLLNGASKTTTSATANLIAHIANNPNYAKLINRFYDQQKLQQQTNNRKLSTAAESPSILLQFPVSTSPALPKLTSTSTTTTTENPNQVYGKIVHYPREFDSESSSNRAAIDRLHKLNQFVRTSASSSSEEQEQLNSNNNNELENNNRIPSNSNQFSPSPSSSSSKGELQLDDDKPAYGSILHRPSQRVNSNTNQHHQGSLSSLRQQLSTANNNGQQRQLDDQQQQQQQEIYGQILIRPSNQTVKGNRQQITDSTNEDNNNNNLMFPSNANWNKQSTLNKLRQQLNPYNEAAALADGSLIESSIVQQNQNSDEMMAGNEKDSFINEFEGTFHTNPIEQVEIRQLRDDEDINGRKKELIVHTTSDSNNVFNID